MRPEHRPLTLDPRDESFVQDPYPFYAELRARGPAFYWTDLDLWCFARHEDVNALLRVLFERLPALRLAAPARYRDTWHFHALESLPVAF